MGYYYESRASRESEHKSGNKRCSASVELALIYDTRIKVIKAKHESVYLLNKEKHRRVAAFVAASVLKKGLIPAQTVLVYLYSVMNSRIR